MRILLFSWLFLIPLFTILFSIDIVLVSSQCLNDQRSLLLQLKNTLQFHYSVSTKLIQWNQSSDCCRWSGVTCDNASHVTGLDLNSESIYGGINHSSGLFSFQFLQSLNLANNSFNPTQIPSGFSNLTSLRYLNLSNSGFSGQIPIELSHMTRLVTLDLSSFYLLGFSSLKLENPNLKMLIANLAELTELHLDGVNISAQGNEWCQALSLLPNLRVLSLSNCDLSGPFDSSLLELQSLSVIQLDRNNLSSPVPEFFANYFNLTSLSLSSCGLNGTFPGKIFQVPTLKTLHLSENRFLQGSLPDFHQNGSLQTLALGKTSFSGALPGTIDNVGTLSKLELANCNFSGPIPNSMANLAQLVFVDLSFNKFTGPIPSFQMSKNLSYIDLSHNNLTGHVLSTHFEGLSNLVNIDLQYNSFNGSIPSSLFALPSLKKIQLSNNQFDGQVPEFSNASSPLLDTLDLSSNNLQGAIPMSFFKLESLNILVLSFNNFSGTIKLETIWKLHNLSRLDLSYNSLSINASGSNSSLSSFPRITTLKLAACKLQNFPDLKNQSGLSYLDLSDNHIDGEIPNWIWKVGNGTLTYLNLSCNLLVYMQRPYHIPDLSVLDLHYNQLHGEIPIPPGSATYVDYSSNKFNSSIPADIGNNLTFAYFFSLSNNGINGTIPDSICNASYLQVLDLSNNGLSGRIPSCLIERSTETLGVLNMGNNSLRGNIPETFSGNCALKTLDLHGNHLEGQVPKSLANCKMLEVLNLGSNKINDTFPYFLKISSSLRVLVLRSNSFQGEIHCPVGHNHSWPNLQIIDLAFNNFSGDLPATCFSNWKAMKIDEDGAQSELNHLQFEILKLNHFYYQDKVTVTNKGLEMELVKILTVFTSIDLSCNKFQGGIPDTVGILKSLYVLNLSHNALTGPIPSSIGNLTQLGSLDLSRNKLNGRIPEQLASLTFLSFLNLSYNLLVGMIPSGSQFQTFTESSFEGNKGLCGYPLNKSCTDAALVPPSSPSSHESGSTLVTEFHWQFIFTGLGFGVGAGIVVGPLMFWKQGRHLCDEHIDNFVLLLLPTLGFLYTSCDNVKAEAEENIEEPTDDTEDSDEDEMEDRAFRGRYCVFCSKLDSSRKKAIHNSKCSCHESPPISSSSSSSSSS
uniref:Putative receptor-like protein 12 n=1 Tax=Davidia involucrata TaxID=16924 RepID=A0A5B7BRI1_DAVIN